MANAADACLEQILEMADKMLELADAGDAARNDVGCGVLYGVLRDSAYKLQRLAAAELEAHLLKSCGPGANRPPEGGGGRQNKLTMPK